MLLFCPGCGNGLIVEEGQRCHRFACNTCPYVHNITRKVRSEPGVGPGASPRPPGAPRPPFPEPTSILAFFPSRFRSALPSSLTGIRPCIPSQCRHPGLLSLSVFGLAAHTCAPYTVVTTAATVVLLTFKPTRDRPVFKNPRQFPRPLSGS